MYPPFVVVPGWLELIPMLPGVDPGPHTKFEAGPWYMLDDPVQYVGL